MNKTLNTVVAVAALLLLASCKDKSLYSGYEKTESGAYMKFIERHQDGDMPRLGDGVTFEMAQYFNDSLLFSTADSEPLKLEIHEGDFVGDVPDALRMMHVGDSASLVVLSDSVFLNAMEVEVPEEFKGKPIYYDLKLLSIKSAEELRAERKAIMDSLRMVEQDYLADLKANPKYTVTESGLIVMEKTGKGRVAQLGEYLNLDLVLSNMDGDTLIDSYGMEPIEIQYGDEFICKGFQEALGMVPAGGMMRFVIPSDQGFDSTGYANFIKPFEPIVVKLQMNKILDEEAYKALLEQREAEEMAERERLLSLEKQMLEQYVKDNDITVQPTETGVYLIPLEEGEGEVAKPGDKVSVHYTLVNLKGDVVESSYDYGTPMSFTLGGGEMIPAIEAALVNMAPGAKCKVLTPSGQAFGEIEIDHELLPAYSPLLIELELVSVE